MRYLTIDDICEFSKKYDKDEGHTKIIEMAGDGAEDAVRSYLGYEPTIQTYDHDVLSFSGQLLPLKARPIVELISISYETKELDAKNFVKHERFLVPPPGLAFNAGFYHLKYTAGFEVVPSIIKMTALQIASLFLESAGGNLATQSTSYPQTGSRTFNNFKMDRFLMQLDSLKLYDI